MWNNYLTHIKPALDVVGLFLISAAVSGFLVINIYLWRFGYYDYSFLRTKYIASGTLYIFFAGLFLFLGFALVKVLISTWKLGTSSKKPWYVILLLVPILISLEFYLWLYLSKTLWALFVPPQAARDAFGQMLLFSISSVRVDFIIWMIMGGVTLLFWKEILRRAREKKPFLEGMDSLNMIIGALLLTFLNLFAFATFIYPYIPEYLGGGESAKVELYFNDAPNLELYGLGTSTQPVAARLMYRTPEELLVQISSSTYSFPSRELKAIKYQDSQQFKLETLTIQPSSNP